MRRCVGIDLEFSPLGGPVGIVPLGIDPIPAPVLTVTGPGDDKVPRIIHGDGGIILARRCVGVDLEFSPLGNAIGIVPLGVDSPIAPVLTIAGPGDNKITCCVSGDTSSARETPCILST